MKIKIVYLLIIIVLLFNLTGYTKSKSIFNSKHNLSTTGDGDIKSNSETRVCIFCHSSHNASAEGPLWNHKTTAPGKFRTYQRSTMISSPEQPNGSTKLCLSCHDGTIAVGAVHNRSSAISMKNVGSSGEIPRSKKSHIGTDLSGTHPVSVKFDQQLALSSGKLNWPLTDDNQSVNTDYNGYVQCTSCHDPHDDSKSEKYPFWKKDTFSEVCKVCHKL